MKKVVLSLALVATMAFVSCKETAKEEAAEANTEAVEATTEAQVETVEAQAETAVRQSRQGNRTAAP